MIARMTDVQKLRQKSHSNNLEISLGALVIISSRTPSFPISRIANAAIRAIYTVAKAIVIKYIVGIVL